MTVKELRAYLEALPPEADDHEVKLYVQDVSFPLYGADVEEDIVFLYT